MAQYIYPALRNSAYKVFQNLLKGNSYSDIVAYKTLKERDDFMTKFLGVDWKKELRKTVQVKNSKTGEMVTREIRKHTINRKDDIHMVVELDMTRETNFTSPQQARQCDLIIMEDTNEKKDSPFRYTFWSASLELTDDTQNYTHLRYQCEMDVFMTIPFENMFKDDVKLRLARGNTTDTMGYDSELSYGEDFQFSMDNYVPVYKGDKKNVRHIFGKKKSDTTLEDCAVIVSLNSSSASASGELLNYQYNFPVYYSQDSANTVTQHVLKLDKLKNPISGSTGLVVPDITYLIFRNKLSIPSEIRRSQYLISLQQLPLPYSILTPYNPDEKVTLDGKQIECIDVSIDSELRKWLSFSLNLNKIDETGKITTETIGQMMRETNDGLLDPHNKMLHSEFNKVVLNYGQLKFEIKSENWDYKSDSGSLEGKLIFTPQAVNMYCDLNNAPYYDINFVWNARAINIASDFKLPTIVSGDQGTLQNFNSINLTNSINQRDATFQKVQGGLQIAGAIMSTSSLGFLGSLFNRGGAALTDKAQEISQGVQMEMSAMDNVNKQAANLADSKNNIGQFNDGSKDGIEAYDSDGVEVYKYQLQEPLRSMVVEYLRMYGFNLGGNLYTTKDHLHARAKHDYIRVADDIGIIYQALREDISPQQAKLIALSLLQGIRLWWTDKFTYVGDYAAENNIIDPKTGVEIPNTDIQ